MPDNALRNLDIRAVEDIADYLLDDELGVGLQRRVFKKYQSNDSVIKLEANPCQNITEYEVWDKVKDTEFAKWFAPVLGISEYGHLLEMVRTRPVRIEEMPQKIPAFFTDMKIENWGMLDGRIVCHDYGIHLLIEKGLTKRMIKAKWWSYNDGK